MYLCVKDRECVQVCVLYSSADRLGLFGVFLGCLHVFSGEHARFFSDVHKTLPGVCRDRFECMYGSFGIYIGLF